ncbi:hypothetical protein C3477_17155 [Mycobacterium kansasii]|nr:hypothetical protein [Mycobacterium kansasii]POX98160.1 hypothetical protein C3479_23520 [Mycobacterium kansasii]POY03186.1 hypothetical protein C3477_17155 [Mycobacterium kansasii]POY06657.1 hypothetical protein C3474_22375 [Mycobacterium kansasii]POY15428.1 hypothetical protein C3476_24905 [Mycobacterium kansasii]
MALIAGPDGTGCGHWAVLLHKHCRPWRAETTDSYGEAQIRWPAGGTGGLGLRHQGRQQQLQTRLRSMCRRITSARCGVEWATVTPTFCHGPLPAARPGPICSHREQNKGTSPG